MNHLKDEYEKKFTTKYEDIDFTVPYVSNTAVFFLKEEQEITETRSMSSIWSLPDSCVQSTPFSTDDDREPELVNFFPDWTSPEKIGPRRKQRLNKSNNECKRHQIQEEINDLQILLSKLPQSGAVSYLDYALKRFHSSYIKILFLCFKLKFSIFFKSALRPVPSICRTSY